LFSKINFSDGPDPRRGLGQVYFPDAIYHK